MLNIIIDTMIDIIKLMPFIFVAFLVIESLEKTINNKNKKIISQNKKYGPVLGGFLGIIPQCGFSVIATDLFITGLISIGTLIAIYISTSDEMLIILLSRKVELNLIIIIFSIKILVSIITGILVDLFNKDNINKKINYEICNKEHCHCDSENIIVASIKHTFKTILFIFIATFIVNIIMEYFGNSFIEKLFMKNSIISPFVSSVVGFIPSCGSSIILTEFYLDKVISFSSMMSGLITNSGVALLVLFRTNNNIKENIKVITVLYIVGSLVGLLLYIFGI